MLNIKKFICNMLQENCYVVSDSTGECVIIDCGAFYPEERQAIVNYIRQNELKPVHLLATHGHFDHNFGNNTMHQEFGLLPEMHINEEALYHSLNDQAKEFTGISLTEKEIPAVGKLLQDNDIITFGQHRFSIIPTPGHTPGGVFFYCKEENTAFSGDTLFRRSIGRTDLAGGSMFQIIQSLRIACQLPDNTVVYPGHGDATTIGEELAENPYLER